MVDRPAPDPLGAFAVLAEPTRRRIYDFVVSYDGPVGRDEVARAAGVGRSLAAFHLDRLAAARLLEVEYRRLSGRRGPGAGRPAKLYRRTSPGIEASVPPRRYGLAAELLAAGIESGDGRARDGLAEAARNHGLAIGAEAREAGTPGTPGGRAAGFERRQDLAEPEAEADLLLEVLAANGFEPERTGSAIRLRNCPFHALRQTHRATTCAMNAALLEGVAEGLGLRHHRPVPEADEDHCCVAFAGPAADAPAAGSG